MAVGSLIIKGLLIIKENQISQVKEFSTFLCTGRCKTLGSLKSFLSYASQPSGASILFFPSMFTTGSGCSQKVLSAIPDCRYCSPSYLPWKAGITDDCDILVYWHGRKYSISQVFWYTFLYFRFVEFFHQWVSSFYQNYNFSTIISSKNMLFLPPHLSGTPVINRYISCWFNCLHNIIQS